MVNQSWDNGNEHTLLPSTSTNYGQARSSRRRIKWPDDQAIGLWKDKTWTYALFSTFVLSELAGSHHLSSPPIRRSTHQPKDHTVTHTDRVSIARSNCQTRLSSTTFASAITLIIALGWTQLLVKCLHTSSTWFVGSTFWQVVGSLLMGRAYMHDGCGY
jgi:hypothetical protein